MMKIQILRKAALTDLDFGGKMKFILYDLQIETQTYRLFDVVEYRLQELSLKVVIDWNGSCFCLLLIRFMHGIFVTLFRNSGGSCYGNSIWCIRCLLFNLYNRELNRVEFIAEQGHEINRYRPNII